jgi:hypothetical protein
VWFEPNAATVQFAIEAFDLGLKERTLDFDRQVADAEIEQLLIRQSVPGESVAHLHRPPCVATTRPFGVRGKSLTEDENKVETTVILRGRVGKTRFQD